MSNEQALQPAAHLPLLAIVAYGNWTHHVEVAVARLPIALIVLSMGLVAPRPMAGQQDTTLVARGTLRGWDEQVRLAVFDRGGSFNGRLSDRGMLQRFNERMDSEYDLDVISSTFALTEQYAWYQRTNGARFWAGSIDEVRLIQHGDFKASVPLGATWAADVLFNYQETLTADRALPWLGFRHTRSNGTQVFLRGTLHAFKPDTDLELGVVLTPRGGRLTLALAALDVFSDFNFQTLSPDSAVVDTSLDYTKHPFTLRAGLDLPLGRQFRTEAYALYLTPTEVVAETNAPGGGFTQGERYAYAGGLIEWGPSSSTAVGLLATWVRATTERAALPQGQPTDDFDLTEETSRIGIYAMHRLMRRIGLEAWIARVWRLEDRVTPDPTVAPSSSYSDRTWAGRNSFVYRADRGFRGELGLDFTLRDTSGRTPVPTITPLDRDNVRMRFDLGWHFGSRAFFLVGANLDLDAGGFDGAHGRFMLNW